MARSTDLLTHELSSNVRSNSVYQDARNEDKQVVLDILVNSDLFKRGSISRQDLTYVFKELGFTDAMVNNLLDAGNVDSSTEVESFLDWMFSSRGSFSSAVDSSSPGVVVVIDPISTGGLLGLGSTERGLDAIRVYSRAFPPEIMTLVPAAAKDVKYLATIMHDDTGDSPLEPTLSQLSVACNGRKIVAVLNGCELGTKFCDRLSEALDLPRNCRTTTIRRVDKWDMGEAVRAAGLRAVCQTRVTSVEEARLALEQYFKPFPRKVVVKPSNSAGTEGVTACFSPDEVINVVQAQLHQENAMGLTKTNILVQEFLDGDEYVLDSVSRNGVHKIIQAWKYDKREIHGSPFVYFGKELLPGDTPELEPLVHYQLKVLSALEIKNGAAHAEVKLTSTGPCLVEVGARAHGGEGAWVPQVQAAMGYTQVSAYLDAMLDEPAFLKLPDVPPSSFRNYVREVKLQFREDGIFRGVNQPTWDIVLSLPSYFSHVILKNPGDRANRTINIMDFPGSINLAHPDRATVASDYTRIHDMMNELFIVDKVMTESEYFLPDQALAA